MPARSDHERTARRWAVGLAILGSALVVPRSGEAQDTPRAGLDDFEMARGMLRDAAVRLDRQGMLHARDRLLRFISDTARAVDAQYAVAEAEYLSVTWKRRLASLGFPRVEIAARMRRASAALDAAIEARPERVEFHALYALCERLWANVTDEGESELHAGRARRHLERAEELDADDPRVIAAGAILYSSTPGADARRESTARLTEALAVLEGVPPNERDRAAGWWALFVRVLRIRALIFPSPEEALSLARETLALEPDLLLVRSILPNLEGMVAALDRRHVPATPEELDWKPVAADPAGDGSAADLPDAVELSYAHGSRDRIWFKFRLDQPFPSGAFGVNLAVDTDGNQGTGQPWWGANRGFTWDRLVTVWVAPEEGGQTYYRGTVGIGDPDGAALGDYTNLVRGEVEFFFPPGEKAIAIGVSSSALGGAENVAVVGSVGSDVNWNDDIPDAESARVPIRGTSRPGRRMRRATTSRLGAHGTSVTVRAIRADHLTLP